jgi:hypothetical protein
MTTKISEAVRPPPLSSLDRITLEKRDADSAYTCLVASETDSP